MVPEDEFIQEARAFAELHLAKDQAAHLARGVKSSSSAEVGNDVVGNIVEVVVVRTAVQVVNHGCNCCHRSTVQSGGKAGS
jgi:hypothetical protein